MEVCSKRVSLRVSTDSAHVLEHFVPCLVSLSILGGGLLKMGFTSGFARQCFAIIQGITGHVQRRSVKHGFHFGFFLGSTMGPVTTGGIRPVLRAHQGITEHV